LSKDSLRSFEGEKESKKHYFKPVLKRGSVTN